ncbi:hypothetical protein BC833DRAFT_590517 [Globomyces pollinis-pini]|nr:hypothetical protein BC833DRAFT_590517 [Globomyces pollinis-pini]
MSYFQTKEKYSQNQLDLDIKMTMVANKLNGVLDACKAKCMQESNGEALMNKGEILCTDRCVSKYFAVLSIFEGKMQERMTAQSEAAQQDQQQTQQQQ